MGLIELINTRPLEVDFRILLVDDRNGNLHRLIQQQEEGQAVEPCLVTIAAEQQAEGKEYLETHPEFDLILLNGAGGYLPDLATAITDYYRILSSYNPFCRLYVFLPRETPYRRQDLTDRGAMAVYSLDTQGWQEFVTHIRDRWFPTLDLAATPEILCADRELSDAEKRALQVLLPNSQQVHVFVHEGGYSDTRKFRVTAREGQAYFVKLGRIDLLEREYKNFQEFIADRVPHFSVSLSAPQQLGLTGLLRMPLIGGAGGTSISFNKFLIDADVSVALDVIDELFEQYKQLQASLQGSREDFRPHYYLRVLPPLLVLQFRGFATPATPGPEDKIFLPPEWDEAELPRHLRQFLATLGKLTGRYILQDLYIEEVRQNATSRLAVLQLTNEERWFKINLEDAPAELISSPKLRYRKPVTLVGELKTHLPGIVSNLLQTLFTDEEAAALGNFPLEWFLDLLLGIWPTGESDKLGTEPADRPDMAQSLHRMPVAQRGLMSPLSRATNLVRGFTHGDFNLENILIQEHRRGVTPWMIDFEKSRRDFYPSCDWSKLEIELALHLAGTNDLSFPLMLALERDLWLPRELHTAVGTTRSLVYSEATAKYHTFVEKIRSQAIPSLASPKIVDYLFGLVCQALSASRFLNAPRAGRRLVYIKAVTLLQAILNCLLREELQKSGADM